MSATIRPPVKWHGGKHYLARRIVDLMPEHHTYVEPFGGGASVLLNKQPAPVEVYNDLDGRIVRLFRVLRDRPDDLGRALVLTPYAEAEFRAAGDQTDDELEQARRDYVRWRMSIGGRGAHFACSTPTRSRRGMADNVSAWLSTIDEVLPAIVERLRRVQLSCRPAVEVLWQYDTPTALHYCDPPYHPDTRQAPDVYGIELTAADHAELLGVLLTCRGRVMLSGYRCPLYDERLRAWHRIDIDMANHAAGGEHKRRMVESLWTNWRP